MPRILFISTMFPDRLRPRFGEIVLRQAVALASRPGIELQILAPIRLPPFPLSKRQRYAPLGTVPEVENWAGLTVYRPRYVTVPHLPQLSPALLARAMLPKLRLLREQFPFDVLTAEFFWPDGPAAARLAEMLQIPFVAKARGTDLLRRTHPPRRRKQLLRCAGGAGRLLAVSAGLRERMIEIGMPAEKIAVHYTGVDRTIFRPQDRSAAKKSLGIDGALLLVPGNIVPSKGHLLALDALRSLEGISMIIAGRGYGQAMVEDHIRRSGLGDRVRILPTVEAERMPQLYSGADVTLLPTAVEGLSNVWVESLACGTPVVTSDVCGAREAIDRPAAGRIVPREPLAIAKAVLELLADPPSTGFVVEAADKFSWERNAVELEQHLTAVATSANCAS